MIRPQFVYQLRALVPMQSRSPLTLDRVFSSRRQAQRHMRAFRSHFGDVPDGKIKIDIVPIMIHQSQEQ